MEYSSQESRQAIETAESKAAADALMAEAKRLSAETNEALRLLHRQEAEFSVRQKMIEPLIVAAEHDRDSARAIKRDSFLLFEQSEARETAVIAAEVGLRAREAKADIAMTEARQMTSKYLQDKSKIESESKSIALQKSIVLKERFRLHRCSSELMKQMTLLKRGIHELTRVSYITDLSVNSGRHPRLLSSNHIQPIESNQAELMEPAQDNHVSLPNDYETYRENYMSWGNKQAEVASVEPKKVFLPQPLLIPLLREFEDATERLHIISEELGLDPFQISNDKPFLERINTPVEFVEKPSNILPNSLNTSSSQYREATSSDESVRVTVGGRVSSTNMNREMLHMAIDPINYSDIRGAVDSAASSFHSLKEIAKSFGVN